ncbi:MAG: carbon-nitrogen hydrolase [Oleiphilaceae bacterium]|nr:carbon-nitrogen hydrolase [Oleiphilaceae bacterium]
MSNVLKVAAIQHEVKSSPDQTLRYLTKKIEACASQGVQLVVLQELHNTAYFCQTESVANFDLAESIPGPSSEHLAAVAKEHGLVIVSSLFERRAPGLYHNTAVVLDKDGSIAGTFRKMHIPDDPGFYEKFYFTPGDADPEKHNGFAPINTSLGKLGVLVCWDQWYPEAARLMALAGAELLIYPTAIGWDPADDQDEQQRQLDAWMTIQRAHAVANGLPVIVCNRTGFEASPASDAEGTQFWGNSFISGPQGELLSQAPTEEEYVLITEIDRERTENVRRIWPYLRDRRVDAYANLTKRYIDQA